MAVVSAVGQQLERVSRGADAAAATWLHLAVPLLEGARPIDRVRVGDVDGVVEVLAGAYAGAFA
jgi:hypothetical protein